MSCYCHRYNSNHVVFSKTKDVTVNATYRPPSSSNEVNNDEVQNNVCKYEVGERSLWSDATKLCLVDWVDLYSQTH